MITHLFNLHGIQDGFWRDFLSVAIDVDVTQPPATGVILDLQVELAIATKEVAKLCLGCKELIFSSAEVYHPVATARRCLKAY